MRKLYIETSCLQHPYTGLAISTEKLINQLKAKDFEVVEFCNDKKITRRSYIYKLIYFNVIIPQFCKKNLSNDDVFFIPNNMGYFMKIPHRNTYVLVHDLIPLTGVGYRGIKRVIYKFKMSQIKNASKIITISEYVKKQIFDTFKVAPRNIDVIYWPSLQRKISSEEKISDYFLSIGTGEPRKNIEFLIQNWINVYEGKYKLILFGKAWQKGIHEKLMALIASHGMQNYILLKGMVNSEELESLYQNAIAFIFPSVEEGFGLPPIEAASYGTNIIVPKTPINYELYYSIAFMYSLGNIRELKICIDNAVDSKKIDVKKFENFCEQYSEEKFKQQIADIFS